MTAPFARVALVLVSHSAQLAAGLAELAGQMAPEVLIEATGGVRTEHGAALGTDGDEVRAAVERAGSQGRAVVVLTDLGSASMTAELVLELLDAELAARVHVVDAPFVEGAVVAAVQAQMGADAHEVVLAALATGAQWAVTVAGGGSADASSALARARSSAGLQAPPGAVRVRLGNSLGLHARPAATLARLAAGFDAVVTIDGVAARSVLALLKLGTAGGQELTVTATGAQAVDALDAVVAAIASGLGEA